jgi:gas vesicle protein
MKPGSFIAGLLTGAVVGGIVALLYAPRSGKETREHMKTKLQEYEKEIENLKNKAKDKSKQVRDAVASKIDELSKELENLSKAV